MSHVSQFLKRARFCKGFSMSEPHKVVPVGERLRAETTSHPCVEQVWRPDCIEFFGAVGNLWLLRYGARIAAVRRALKMIGPTFNDRERRIDKRRGVFL